MWKSDLKETGRKRKERRNNRFQRLKREMDGVNMVQTNFPNSLSKEGKEYTDTYHQSPTLKN